MVLGIDLGSSNTVAATLSRDGVPVIIPDYLYKSNEATPSQVIIDGERAYIGQTAINLADIYANKEIIRFFKRKFGTQLPVAFTANREPIFSETVAALVLKKVLFDAKIFSNAAPEKTVITIPSHYNHLQRRSVFEAARLAGISLTTILDEPVAAALLYSKQHKFDDELIMVYDMGGGTFDLTVLTCSDNKLHVVAKGGLSNLGGKEFDEITENNIYTAYNSLFGQANGFSDFDRNRIKKVSEELKVALNGKEQSNIEKWLYAGGKFFSVFFDKKEYSMQANELIAKTETAITNCLRPLGMKLSDIHKIILTGGVCNSQLVQEFWKNKIDPQKQSIILHQPLTSVAKGAAIYADSITTQGSEFQSVYELKTVSTYNIGILTPGGTNVDTFIHKNMPLPTTGTRQYKIANSLRKSSTELSLVQYFDDPADYVDLGTMVIQLPSSGDSDTFLDIIIENKLNGTLGVKIKNASTGDNLRFDFSKKTPEYEYNFEHQLKLLNSFAINSIS